MEKTETIELNIPKEADDFFLNFSELKNSLSFGEYFSDGDKCNISYRKGNEKCRISNKTKRIELTPEIKKMTQDLVYFICMQLYLLRDDTIMLLSSEEEKYKQSDLIAIKKCKEHKMDAKKLIKDIIHYLKYAPTELNTKRIEHLIKNEL